MNILKKLRKPYLSILMASLILFISCGQENLQIENKEQAFDGRSLNLAKNQLDGFNLNSTKSSDNVKNHQIMDYMQAQNNVSIVFSESLYELNDKTTDEKISIALQSGVLNQSDLDLIGNLELNLRNDNFENVISNFENEIINLNLSDEKFEVFNTFVNSLKLSNSLDSTIFQSNDYAKDFDCVLATIAFAAAAVGLATLEVGSGGLATAAVVVGYIAASAAWVRACRPSSEDE